MNEELQKVLSSISDAVDFFLLGTPLQDVNRRGVFGNTPLKIAAVRGDLEATRVLLDNGADVNALQEDVCTALHYGASFGHSDVVALLLERGAAVDRIDRFGKSALDYAKGSGDAEAVRLIEARIALSKA
jgi:ankyrin repeat protein